MAIKLSVAIRNQRLDAIENGAVSPATTGVGAAPLLRLYDLTAAAPASTAAAITAVQLAEMTLPSGWMADASGGSKGIAGSWTVAATAGGTCDFFRIYDSTGTTCHIQGTVTSVATGTGDMLLDNDVIVTTQVVTITAFTLTDANG